MLKEDDFYGVEVGFDAIKGATFFNQTAERIYLGDKGYKNKDEEMTPLEKELYGNFESNMGKYLFLVGLEKHNEDTLEEIEEKRKYLITAAMFDKKDKDLVSKRIKLVDQLMEQKVGCEYVTFYNKTRFDVVLFKPTHNELVEFLNNKEKIKK